MGFIITRAGTVRIVNQALIGPRYFANKDPSFMQLNSKSTALILIDLQKGILARPLAPRTGADVFARATDLAMRFRKAAAPVVRVKVVWARDYGDAPLNNVDEPMPRPPGGLPAEWGEFPDDPQAQGDIVVTKRHWGAFYGTDLDVQLRRRGVKTIVLGGIATNFGVESTARQAWEHNYEVVIVEDVMTTVSAEMHEFSIRKIMPRIARVTTAAEIVLE
jgi:nicotinamidase-related amidase